MRLQQKSWTVGLLTAVLTASVLPALSGAAQASPHKARAASMPALNAQLFATAPILSGGVPATNPDDITRLGSLVYVTFQNNAGPDGSPAGSFSTIAAYQLSTGHLVRTITLPGRCDGLTADPEHGRILASVNEDNNSSLFVIRPGSSTPVQYTYSPSPAQTGTDGVNGGTDAISITPDGAIYVAHSNPDLTQPAPDNPAAVYRVRLDDGIAHLSRVFGVNDKAKVINPAPGAPAWAPLGLTDPDSNRFLPGDGGTLVQDAQADSKLVFATQLNRDEPTLSLLNLTNAAPTSSGMPATPQLDDVAQVWGSGLLFVVDQKGDTIYTIDTSNVRAGTVFVSQPKPSTGDLPNDPALGVVDLRTGVVTHLTLTFVSPKGLLFIPGLPGDE